VTGAVFVPLVTPLDEQGRVCAASVDRLVESLRAEVDGLVPCLSTGEGWLLDDVRWLDMVRETVYRARSELLVWAGALRPTAAEVIALGHTARSVGVGAIVVTGPIGQPVTQDEIYEHFQAICAASDIPVVIYHEPVLCRTSMDLQTLESVCQLPSVVAVKESTYDTDTLRTVIQQLTLPVFVGREEHLEHSRGAAGTIAALANLNPRSCAEMVADPTADRQNGIDALCRQYGLYREDWYRWTKQELHRRGVISADATVEASSRGLAGQAARLRCRGAITAARLCARRSGIIGFRWPGPRIWTSRNLPYYWTRNS
jgi:4-hydroxy-tetrahydrodipicolinate synthase